jgi:hypothetical protein
MFGLLLESVLPKFDHYLPGDLYFSRYYCQSLKYWDQVPMVQLYIFIAA